jgi:3-hydroxyacyl-CoA dehydrogenase/enoyl-CoA hydratase/3-hydroxybutyryl-CoA epimerase
MSKIRLEVNGAEAKLIFDNEDGRANIFDRDTLEELEKHIGNLETNREVKRLYISSAKKNIFIAGADINQIKGIENKRDAVAAAQIGQRIFQRLANLRCYKIALIHGACMGGGLELTLACDARIASDDKKTKLALPEVKLGILPAWGGSTRLPRLLRYDKAVDLLLSGKSLDGIRALKCGLVDACCPQELLEDVAKKFKAKRKWSFKKALFRSAPLRNHIHRKARKSVEKATRNNYPAPQEILEHLEDEAHGSEETSLESEAERLGELAVSSECKNLVQLFLNKESADKNKDLQESVRKMPEIKNLGTLGAGVMGGGIAHLAAKKGFEVRMRDLNVEGLSLGMQAASKIVNSELKRRRIKDYEAKKIMSRILPVLDLKGFDQVDVVIEAIIENMEIKKSALAELESIVSEDCIIATNTSSLSVTEMATALERPKNFVGMHFFNPVNRMPLVEVIKGKKTSKKTLAAIVELTQAMGKTPVVVADGPGFLVNRLLTPYMNEALLLVEENDCPEHIDEALLQYGMPMGPCHLVDEVGVDVASKVSHILEEGLGSRMRGSALADDMVSKKKLGRKSGEGFYKYKGKKKEISSRFAKFSWNRSIEEIQMRCLLPMWNEALRCLDEKVVSSPEELDLAMILGTGYAPFRGGPFSAAKTMGWRQVRERLDNMAQKYGDRYTPAKCIVDYLE